MKRTGWNLRASSTKWTEFKEELEKRKTKATDIITDPSKPIDIRYKKWFTEIETAARKTIGKTTYKVGGKEKFSKEVNRLRDEKRSIKKNIQEQTQWLKATSFPVGPQRLGIGHNTSLPVEPQPLGTGHNMSFQTTTRITTSHVTRPITTADPSDQTIDHTTAD